MTLTLQATDVSGQKRVRVTGVSPDFTVGELVEGLVSEMELPRHGSEGQALSYHVLLDREARHLHATNRVGDEVAAEDLLVLHPSIDAASVS